MKALLFVIAAGIVLGHAWPTCQATAPAAPAVSAESDQGEEP
jgi:xanthosine utilization system XapX-like protein